MEPFDIRARIKELLQEKGMSNAKLARCLGIDRRIVSYWTTYERRINADMLLNICEAFGITPNEFFKLEGKSEARKEYLKHLRQLDSEMLRKKLQNLNEQAFLVELALHSKDELFQESLMLSLVDEE